MASRIYLDNAATSWPKPDAVYEAIDSFQRENGASAGRSTYSHATDARRVVEQTRAQLVAFLNAPMDSQLAFAFNGTDALNQCIHGLLQPGDHVITTALEHNSVLRPLQFLADRSDVAVDFVAPTPAGVVAVEGVRALLRPTTRLVAITHASNVTGVIQPVPDVVEVAHQHNAIVLLDAAQTLGHITTDVSALGVDMLAASGHKGLLGPLGTALLYLAPGIAEQVSPFRQGGTGSQSVDERQPEHSPDKFESGNMNVPGLAGLAAGTRFVAENLDKLHASELALTAKLTDGLRGMQGIELIADVEPVERVGVVSFTSDSYDPHELASLLDAEGGIQVRAGLHCAPRTHQYLGSIDGGGTVRVSFGPFNTSVDVDALLALLQELHD